MSRLRENVRTQVFCAHCGQTCSSKTFYAEGAGSEKKYFCCFGCKTVYELLAENDLGEYYSCDVTPGTSQKNRSQQKYDILNRDDVKKNFLLFANGDVMHVCFTLPQIHCSSCIWLLENLHRLHKGVLDSRVDFSKKEIVIAVNSELLSVKEIAELLDAAGYQPYISLEQENNIAQPNIKNNRILKIGVAGFCFGNIMLFSFPEYFAGGEINESKLNVLFHYLSLLFSLLVLLYAATEFFVSAVAGLRNRFLNIDAPIALAIIFTFLRSLYAVFIEAENGYFDSMSGIVFFMLIGRYLQDKTYRYLSFERSYKSYFPLSSAKVQDGIETQVTLQEIKPGDKIRIRNAELIPTDSILINGDALIDYSFVTGESKPVRKQAHEILFAGGRQIGALIDVQAVKEVSQSYLTELWNRFEMKGEVSNRDTLIQKISRYFSIIVLSLASLAAIYWLVSDKSRAFDAFITPLIVACPCALLLSSTFANAGAIAKLGRVGVYIKNANVFDKLAGITTIIFDKTGTITDAQNFEVEFSGSELTEELKQEIASITNHSQHPYSKAITKYLCCDVLFDVKDVVEKPGLGIGGYVKDKIVLIGAAKYVGANKEVSAGSYVSVDGKVKGYFTFKTKFPTRIKDVIRSLQQKYKIFLLSGDSDGEKQKLDSLFGLQAQEYQATPFRKIDFVKEKQQHGEKVMMVGDGLNDAGALLKSEVGVAVSADANYFSPASDIIIRREHISGLDKILLYSKWVRNIIFASLIFSIVYNGIGLYFALQGELSPMIAAVLMPASTISILIITSGGTALFSKKLPGKLTIS
ncbi:MAG: heavy metal translocating P-type ATPase [Chitinophagales bacterium]